MFRQSIKNKALFFKSATALGCSFGVQALFLNCAFAEDTKKTRVFSWGASQYFQTGLGRNKGVYSPEPVSFFDDVAIADIQAGGQQTFVLAKDGKVYSFGRGDDGRLGHGGEANEVLPRVVESLLGTKIASLSCGEKHVAAVTEDGDLYTWGRGHSGQLGRDPSDLPRKVPGMANIKAVSCGKFHTVAVDSSGRVFSCGEGRSAALGHGDRDSREQFELVGNLKDVKITDVAAGEDFSLFLSEDGRLFSCGATDFGQAGLGQAQRYILKPKVIAFLNQLNIEKISTKYLHSIALPGKADCAFLWGMNKTGQLGLGDNNVRAIPTKLVLGELKLIQADCGAGHSAFLAEDLNGKRRLFLSGNGRDGQLGRGDSIESVAAFRTNPLELVGPFSDCQVQKVSLGSDHSVCLCEVNS